jgi:hypothetical protein
LNQRREPRSVWQLAGFLLVISLDSYCSRELLVCWVFFGMVFLSLLAIALGGIFAGYAGKSFISWANTAARVKPIIALGSPDLQMKIVSDELKLK